MSVSPLFGISVVAGRARDAVQFDGVELVRHASLAAMCIILISPKLSALGDPERLENGLVHFQLK
jgi:hypothetical protein